MVTDSVDGGKGIDIITGAAPPTPTITVAAAQHVTEGGTFHFDQTSQMYQGLVTLTDNGAGVADTNMTLSVSDKLGTLAFGDLDGSTQSGSGAPGGTLTLNSTVEQLRTALATLSYTAPGAAGSDTVSISYQDNTDGLSASGLLGITVTPPSSPPSVITPPVITPPVITPPTTASQNFAYTDTATGAPGTSAGTAYVGPVSYLTQQYVWDGTDGVAMSADTGSVFMHGGPGDDALHALSGSNVLDGGAGSNFLVGASGTDGGSDTFFDDGRGGHVTWDTLVNFHHGDAVTIFGFNGGLSTMQWADGQGATGYAGATLHSELGGAGTGINASVTFAGLSVSDALAKLTISTGNVDGNAYVYLKYN